MTIETLFLSHVRAQTHLQFFPSHSNQSLTLQKNPADYQNLRSFSKTNYVRQRPGFYQILPYPANILHENKRDKKGTFSPLCHHTFEDSFLINFSFPLFCSPSHEDISLQSMSATKQDMPKPLLLHFFPDLFPISSLKLFPLSYNQKSLMKPDTFESTPPFFLQLYPLHHLIMFLICL